MPEPKVYHRQTPRPTAVDEDARIIFLPVEQIRPNRAQPRNRFDTNTMIRLADSVRRYGVLQPLTVRRTSPAECEGANALPYELIAGERRLRAAKLAGLSQVPCILAHADDHLSAELAIIENLLREDLDMFEQARAFGRLIVRFSLTQEQVARKMSMSQSAVANKLRLLRLNEAEQRLILEGDLTERHARALLRLPADEARSAAIRQIIERHLNVASSEEYIEALLAARRETQGAGNDADGCREEMLAQTTAPHAVSERPALSVDRMPREGSETAESADGPQRKKLVLKDLRVFCNSIENAVEILKQTGMRPTIEQQEDGERLTIRIVVDKPTMEK